jgi:hypothetical protein
MVDLIPIGTVNRTAAENNSIKSSDNVKETAQSDPVSADNRQRVDEPRRRFKRRKGDRRVTRGVRWTKPERRKNPDRRTSSVNREPDDRLAGETETPETKGSSRKGRFIDVRA